MFREERLGAGSNLRAARSNLRAAGSSRLAELPV